MGNYLLKMENDPQKDIVLPMFDLIVKIVDMRLDQLGITKLSTASQKTAVDEPKDDPEDCDEIPEQLKNHPLFLQVTKSLNTEGPVNVENYARGIVEGREDILDSLNRAVKEIKFNDEKEDFYYERKDVNFVKLQ